MCSLCVYCCGSYKKYFCKSEINETCLNLLSVIGVSSSVSVTPIIFPKPFVWMFTNWNN